MSIVLAMMGVVGFVAAALLMFVAIAVARIAIADDLLLVGAFGFSGICSLGFTIGYFIRWAVSTVWWQQPLIAGFGAMAVFAGAILVLLVRTIGLRSYSPDRPSSVRRKFPGLRTLATLLAVGISLIVIDSLTGSRGWGLVIGLFLIFIGPLYAWLAPIYRWHFTERLTDIDDFEPELLASLNNGRVSRHVLRIIRRRAEIEESRDSRQSPAVQ